jgi:nitrous oxide reductase accessory protein NosL
MEPRAAGILAFLALACFLSFPGLTAQGAEKASVKPGPNDKCPVCGMLVEPFPNWWAAVVFTDGTRAFFDGPRDMFKYISNLKKFNPSKRESDIAAVYVTDYYGVTQIDGRKAWYVTGSDVNGPMGPELVPFEKESDARAFLKDHKGKKVLTFESAAPDGSTGGKSHMDHGRHE